MNPVAQGADPIPSTACVDTKRLPCSAMPDDSVSKFLDNDNTSSWLPPMTPLDDEDLLREILLRLPPKPSSFPRASLVCNRWRCILSEPRFLCRFQKHHGKPSLLGFFDVEGCRATIFTPVLEPPDRIPATSLMLLEKLIGSEPWECSFFGCRHGIALLLDRKRRKVVLWDPLNGVQCHVAFPRRFRDNYIRSAALLCADNDKQHVHGDCHMSPFKLVLVYHDDKAKKPFVYTYESKTGVWGDIISTTTMTVNCVSLQRPSILVGNALFWLLDGGDILEFDFERLTLAVIKKPTDFHVIDFGVEWAFQILRGHDNGLGLAILSRSKLSIQLWARKSNYDGGVSWVLQNTVPLDEIFSRPLHRGAQKLVLMPGYHEDTNVIFLSSASHDFILQIESKQLNYIGRREYRSFRVYYPYTNFYTAVRSTAGGDRWS